MPKLPVDSEMLEDVVNALKYYARNIPLYKPGIDAICGLQNALKQETPSALYRFKQLVNDSEDTEPIERLRFFCSLAMNSQDWFDVEPFFRALPVPTETSWQPIETAPADGACLVYVETDDEPWIGRLERDKKGNWIHDGEPTYCLGYYFKPTLWMHLPAAPKGGE